MRVLRLGGNLERKKMASGVLATCTLFVSNIPSDVQNKELEDVFSEVGPLKRCFMVKDKGFGYVTYAIREDAESAIEKIKSISGRRLNIKFANRRCDAPTRSKKKTDEGGSLNDASTVNDEDPTKSKEKLRKKGPNKKGRLIVRNLSFKASEKDVRKEFAKYGKVLEVSIPKKPDGKMFGFCFVQFAEFREAAFAIKAMNARKILGRIVAVDWSLQKEKYLEAMKEAKELEEPEQKDPNMNQDRSPDASSSEATEKKLALQGKRKMQNTSKTAPKKVKLMASSNASLEKDVIADLTDDDDAEYANDGSDPKDSAADENSESSEEESDAEDDADSDVEDDDEPVTEDDENTDENSISEDVDNRRSKKERKKSKVMKSDVGEGKTIFIRNIGFDISQEEFHAVFSEFGNLEYAKICIDPNTEHSRGSGFVKFKTKDDAEKCLEASDKEEGIMLGGQRLQVTIALTKEELKKQVEEKVKQKKDSRNLYLAREGLIRAGTKAAEGVSAHDMTKRMEVEVWKKRMLNNLHVFVARNRLCVRNIPPHVNNDKLYKVFSKAAGPDAKITECRVIRNLRRIGSKGLAESKGFGFVTFTDHTSALKALRGTNNNPSIFTHDQRPIVEFSLENRAALNAKQKRLEKSRQKNQELKSKKGIESNDKASGAEKVSLGDDSLPFAGIKTDPSLPTMGLPSHLGPKIRHRQRDAGSKISRRNIQKQKLKYRKEKAKQRQLSKSIKRNKKNKKSLNAGEAHLDSLVLKRKQKLESGSAVPNAKRKWFSRR